MDQLCLGTDTLPFKPPWIKSLLQNVHFFTDTGELDMEVIWTALQTNGYLLMVSDGSMCYISSMSFGWILATLDGIWLAAANGPSMGQGSSLRAEGDGMLSDSLFLSLIADEYPSKQCTIKYISDNFGFIEQNTEHLEYEITYPNTTI